MASKDTTKEDEEEAAGMTIIEASQPIDMVAAAFDNPNPQSIIVGHGKLAFSSNYDSDDESILSTTYSPIQGEPTTAGYVTNNIHRGTPTRRAKKSRDSQISIDHLSCKAALPQQLNLTVSGQVNAAQRPVEAQAIPAPPARCPSPQSKGAEIPYFMLALLFATVAAASSATTLLMSSWFSQGPPVTSSQPWAWLHISPNHISAINEWLSAPALRLMLYDSIGQALAFMTLLAVTELVLRTGLTWLNLSQCINLSGSTSGEN